MNIWLVLLILLLIFGLPFGAWHLGGPSGLYMGGGLGLVIIIVVILMVFGR